MSGRTMASQGFARAPGAKNDLGRNPMDDRKQKGTIAVEIQLALVLVTGQY